MAEKIKAEVQSALKVFQPRLQALHKLVDSHNDPIASALLNELHAAAEDIFVKKLGYELESGGK